jgi:translation initiation factor IF-3
MAHTELGRKILDRLVGDLGELAIVEAMPKQEGRNMIMVIGPNKRHLEDLAKQEARAAREAAKEAAAADTEADPEPIENDALEPTADDAAALDPTAETVAPAADEG